LLREGAAGTVRTVTQYGYDSLGRLECTAVRMNPALFASLPASACTPALPAGGDGPDRITRNVYDAAGQRLQLREGVGTDVEGTEATWDYNANGQVRTVIDGNGNRAELRYDGHGRQDRWTFPSPDRPAAYDDSTPASALASAGGVNADDYEGYAYDPTGNRLSLRKRDGTVIGYSYDALNRLTGRDLPANAWYNLDRSFAYDNLGRMVSASGNGTIALSWDGFGRLTAETGPFGTIGYEYDAAGRRTRLTWPGGFYVTYDYFDNGALAHIRENGAASGPGVLATFTYDALGRRTRLDRGNGAATTYDYDGLSRLAGLHHLFAGGAGDVAWSYDYNPASGLRTTARDNDSYAWAGHYAVDRNYITNGRNQYVAAGTTGFGYDLNGNLTSDGTRGFEYNAENRLTVGYIGAAHQELIDDSRDRLFRYYDGTANRWLLYDGTDLIAEVAGSGATLQRYVHGLGEDEPLVRYDVAGTGERHWLHADAQGSIVALSGANGALTAINRYDEYGIPAASNVGRFQYTGQVWLPELGLYYYRARIYSPSLGRFMQTDPIGYDDQFNLYAYVGDDPINHTDPDGMQTIEQYRYSAEQIGGYFAGIASDLGELAGGIAQGRLEWAFGGMPPTISGGLGGLAAAPRAAGELSAAVRGTANAESAAARASQIHAELDTIAQSHRTTAVLQTDRGAIAATGGRDMATAQRGTLRPGESVARAPGAHAEATVLREAQASGASPRALGTSRPMCPNCQAVVRASGGKITGPTTAIWRPWWRRWLPF
jgi:RHS repeat-associated protein